MIITELEILKVPPSWVWLRIHTDQGITGIGKCSGWPRVVGGTPFWGAVPS